VTGRKRWVMGWIWVGARSVCICFRVFRRNCQTVPGEVAL